MRIRVAAAAALFAWLPTAAYQQPAGGSIEGTVQRAGTNTPIEGANVTLAKTQGDPAQNVNVISDADGGFAFKDLAPGSYRLTVTLNGYLKEEFGQRVPSRAGTPITLAAGQSMKEISITLTPTGTVSGRIRDGDGEPLGGIPVYLLRYRYGASGKAVFSAAGSTQTDDRGDFRLYWLTPGKYYLYAGGPREKKGMSLGGNPVTRPANPNDTPETYAFTFHPNLTDFKLAKPIDVAPGVELDALDFTMKLQPLYHIRGRIIDAKTGQPPPVARISVSLRLPTTDGISGSGYYNPANGAMDIPDLPSGPYVISVSIPESQPGAGGRGTGGGARAGERYCPGSAQAGRPSTSVPVIVTDSDVQDVRIVLGAEDVILRGRIRSDIEGVVGGNGGTVGLVPVEDNPELRGYTSECAEDDGAFVFKNVSAGEYWVTRGRLPANSYIKEIRFGGADALDTPIQYSSSSDNILDIVLGPANAEISGNVVDKRRQPVFDVQVVLIPNKPRRRPDLFKQVFTDASGRFTLRNVVPGDYKLFALESIEQYSWFDPVVLESLETNAAKGEAVHVDEGGKTTINLTSIPGRPE